MHARRIKLIGSILGCLLFLSACVPSLTPEGGKTQEPPPTAGKPTNTAPATAAPTETPRQTAWVADIAAGDQDLRLFGEDPAGYEYDVPDTLGISIAAGDFDGDGYQDVLVGASGADGPGNLREHAGEAYVVFGSPEIKPDWDVAGTAGPKPDVRIYGEETGVGSTMFAPGDSLAEVLAAGDVDGDGYDDLILASTLADGPGNQRPDAGAVYVFFGRPREEWEKLRASPGESILLDVAGAVGPVPDVVIHGEEIEDVLGCSLSAGDVDGDGIEDLTAGACYADGPANGRNNAGAAYMFLGRSQKDWQKLGVVDLAVSPEKADVAFDGASAGDQLGCALASGGDANGDGVADLLLGAPKGDGREDAAPDAGEAYLFFGRDAAAWRSLTPADLAAGAADAVIFGADAGDNLGGFMGLWMADADADGLDDLLIGAANAAGPGNKRQAAGEAYMLRGRTQWGAEWDLGAGQADAVFYGAEAGDWFGCSIGSGDMNGDGIPDILIGAYGADGSENGKFDASGEAYVFYGRAYSKGETIDLSVPDAAQIVVYGEENGDNLGYAVSSGDVNGDRIDDILTGASYADGPKNVRPDAGEAYVIFGRK